MTAAPLRWGLIGAAAIGRYWMVDAIRQARGVVSAVVSRDAEHGRNYAMACRISKSLTSLEALWPEIDAVYIATTNDRHRDACVAAAAAGKHVLCEKPLATRLADAEPLIAACRQAGVVLGVNHHLRNAPAHRVAREAIAAGRIGRPLAARVLHGGALPEHLHGWRLHTPGAGAGVVLDLTVHDADLLRFLLNDEPESVSAAAQNGGLASDGIEDAVMGVIIFRSGLLAQFADSFTMPAVRSAVEIHGSLGSILMPDTMAPTPKGAVVIRTEEGEQVLPMVVENTYMHVIEAMHKAIAGKGQPTASGEDGLRSLAVALAALRSAGSGRSEHIGEPA